jgi:hypothetical protein
MRLLTAPNSLLPELVIAPFEKEAVRTVVGVSNRATNSARVSMVDASEVRFVVDVRIVKDPETFVKEPVCKVVIRPTLLAVLAMKDVVSTTAFAAPQARAVTTVKATNFVFIVFIVLVVLLLGIAIR